MSPSLVGRTVGFDPGRSTFHDGTTCKFPCTIRDPLAGEALTFEITIESIER